MYFIRKTQLFKLFSEKKDFKMSQQWDLPKSMAWGYIDRMEFGKIERSVWNVRRQPEKGRPRATTVTNDRYRYNTFNNLLIQIIQTTPLHRLP